MSPSLQSAAAASPTVPTLPPDCPVVHVTSRNIDMELVLWLQKLGIDRDVIDKVRLPLCRVARVERCL